MIFSGNLAVDPSQLTHIHTMKPTKAFKKMLYLMTAGAVSDKEEHETFCALGILQQLNACFRSLGIDNIVRLAKDDVDFYLDNEGREGDLQAALEQFQLEVDGVEAGVFGTLHLTLEHEDETFKYLIEVEVNRTHAVGAYPIEIEVNGLLRRFEAPADSRHALLEKMQPAFQSQDAYNDLVESSKQQFVQMMGSLEMALKKHIRVDDIRNNHQLEMLRPSKKIEARSAMPHTRGASPVFSGYHGFDGFFFYAWMWAELCHDHHIHVSDVTLLDEAGASLIDVGASGFDAGSTDILDTDVAFDSVGTLGMIEPVRAATGVDSDASWSWFDSGSGDAGDGGSACSSCSSCSSCGGCS